MSTDEDEGRQPWLHRLAIAVNGPATALSAEDGQIDGRGAHGLYVDDRRVLSVLRARLGERDGVGVAWSAQGAQAEFLSSARHLGNEGPDPTVELHRRREVGGVGMTEVFTVTSRADHPLDTELLLELGGDGADIGAVKSGTASGPLLPVDVDPGGAAMSWSDARHTTTVRVDPGPSRVGVQAATGLARVVCPLRIDPGERAQVRLTVEVSRVAPSLFDADAGADRVGWDEVEVVADDPRLGPAVHASLDDLRHLLLTDPECRSDVFAAAGSPWYLTLFGRDSLWAARMTLPFGTELAAGTLRALARRQGTAYDEPAAEAPGRIPHEVRRAAYEDTLQGLRLPPVYYGSIDATPLWICLLHDAWRWGLADEVVRGLLPHLRAATRWLVEDASPDGDGLLKYLDTSGAGLANQGWKDSADAVRWRDGRIAQGPIALVEAQAYAVEAAGDAAALLEAFAGKGERGEPGEHGDDEAEADRGEADRLRHWAVRLRERVRDRYWVGDPSRPWLGIAVAGTGRTVDGLASNMGHVLGTGTLDAREVDRVAGWLSAEPLLSPYGVRTLARDNGGFNPIGYHTGSIWTHDTAVCAWGLSRDGRPQEAAALARALLASAEAFDLRWPELYAGEGVLGRPVPYPASCRPQAWAAASAGVLVTVALGLRADVPGARLEVRPARPAPFGAMTVRGLRWGVHTLTVRVDVDGSVDVTAVPPLPPETTLVTP